ncbi:hypothetical protein CL632_02350 [bacterium]|jgi:hypothetical protein|nr:hypothetical protein [bacterium]MDP6571675.1 type I restriction enzyme HsdR N-terminal domain-containing protein [Patescibacteria group bacterium]|tara:strand:+ start:6781 stop:7209 length:429 start_codon:yes stop_codon:yes gene_type:complete
MYTIPLQLIQPWLIFDKQTYELDVFDAAARVRAKFYFDLIDVCHYPPSRIVFDVLVAGGSNAHVADIVCYKDMAHNKPFLVAKCREDWVHDTAFSDTCERALCDARSLGAQYAACVAGSRVRVVKVSDGSALTKVPEWNGAG